MQPTRSCGDNHSFSAFKAQYGKKVEAIQWANYLNLDERTIRQSFARLRDQGLLGDNGSACDPPEPLQSWFIFSKQLKESDDKRFRSSLEKGEVSAPHFGNWYGYTYYFVPAKDNNIISTSDAAIFSYILHCGFNSFSPHGGWTDSYLSVVTGIDRHIIRKCLEHLEENHFVYQEGKKFRFKKWSAEHIACFANKDEKNCEGEVIFDDELCPELKLKPAFNDNKESRTQNIKALQVRLVNDFELEKTANAEMTKKIMEINKWMEEWKEWLDQVCNTSLDCDKRNVLLAELLHNKMLEQNPIL